MIINRRGFLSGIIAAGIAPAIIRTPGLLMPVKPSLVMMRPEFKRSVLHQLIDTITFDTERDWKTTEIALSPSVFCQLRDELTVFYSSVVEHGTVGFDHRRPPLQQFKITGVPIRIITQDGPFAEITCKHKHILQGVEFHRMIGIV